jgi:hypothetical protein
MGGVFEDGRKKVMIRIACIEAAGLFGVTATILYPPVRARGALAFL